MSGGLEFGLLLSEHFFQLGDISLGLLDIGIRRAGGLLLLQDVPLLVKERLGGVPVLSHKKQAAAGVR